MNKLIEELLELRSAKVDPNKAYNYTTGLDDSFALVKKHMGHPCEPCAEKEKCQPELRDKPCALFPEKGKSCENCGIEHCSKKKPCPNCKYWQPKADTLNLVNLLEIMRHIDNRLTALTDIVKALASDEYVVQRTVKAKLEKFEAKGGK